MADREKVIAFLAELSEPNWPMWFSESEVSTVAKDAMELLKKQEPKQGHWNLLDESNGWFECSECGDIACCAGNYCQACGARMAGEAE